MEQVWKRIAIYTMLRLLACGDLDSDDAGFIRQQLLDAGGTEDDAASFLALYREHR